MSNSTDVPQVIVGHTSDFHDTETFGLYSKLDEVAVANGQTALACCVVPLEVVSAGYGTLKTTYGLRSTQSNRRDGYMLTHVKNHGIIPDYTQKVIILIDGLYKRLLIFL